VIGDVYAQKNQLDSAQIIFEEALDISQKNGLKSFETSIIHRLGKVYYQKGDLKKATTILSKGLEIAQANGFLDELSKIHKILTQVYVFQGDIEKAFQHQSDHLLLFDSLVNKSQQDRISVLQKSFEENLVHSELQFMKFQFQSQSSRLSLARNLNFVIGFGVVFFSFFVIWLYHLIKKIRKTNLRLMTQKEMIFNQNVEMMNKSKQLEEINRTKNKLFSILGHDFRGPIGQIKTIVDMLLDGDLNQNEFDELLYKLKKDLDSVYFTLNNTLSWSFSQMEGFRIHQIEFNLVELVNSTIQLLTPQFKEKSIQVENLMPENVTVFADPDLIVVLIRNILNNAAKFSEIGEYVKITSDQKDCFVYWCVIDFGTGMDQQLINSILTKDYVIHRSHRGTTQEKGSGLGLQVCKEFARLNGGELTIQSALNFGTVVCVKIPAAQSNEVHATRKRKSVKS
jgi:signal transduction histidine kinase